MLPDAALPNFLIIGSAKAGTTTLYEYLTHHPHIYMSTVKEPQFFCHDSLYSKGLDYYANTYFKGSTGFAARGEATPHYLYFEKVAQRLSRDLPKDHQRFIVIMRDPVSRAHSLYWNMVHEGLEELSFEDAIRSEPQRDKQAEIEGSCTLQYQYISSSRYAEQIRRYLKYFDREQFLFLFIEDLMANPAATLDQVYRFLGVPPCDQAIATKTFNSANAPRFGWLHDFLRKPRPWKQRLGRLLSIEQKYRIASMLLAVNRRKAQYHPLRTETDRELRNLFAEDVRDLQTLTGRDLTAWLPASEVGAKPAAGCS